MNKSPQRELHTTNRKRSAPYHGELDWAFEMILANDEKIAENSFVVIPLEPQVH